MTKTRKTSMLILPFARILGLTIGLALLTYLLLALILYFSQYRLLYHPDRYSFTTAIQRATQLGLQPWPLSANDLHGYRSENPPVSPHGTLLIFHGNAGSALDRIDYVSDLQRHGFRVILVEYPSYGPRPGKLGETSLVSAARATAHAAAATYPEPVYLLGESLGCGVACAVAADTTCPIAGILLITPWDSLPNLARDLYPYFATRHLTHDTYHNINNLQAFQGPIGIVMADQDTIVPNQRTRALVDALGRRARLWILPNVGHNDWTLAVDPDWWQQVSSHLQFHP